MEPRAYLADAGIKTVLQDITQSVRLHVRKQWTRQERQPESIMHLIPKVVDTNRHMNISVLRLVKWKIQVLVNLSKAPRCLDKNVSGE